jgi:nicotinamide mononucleotide transporter
MTDYLLNIFPDTFQDWFTWNNLLQIIGALTGIWSIYLIGKAKILGWWLTFPGIMASIIIFYESALYGEMGLQFIFGISGAVGIYNWQVLGKQKQVQVLHYLNKRWYLYYALLTATLYFLLFALLSSFTDTTTPEIDALITALSLVAQLMLTRQILDNWTLWIIVDALSIGLYWHKGIHLYSGLYFAYLFLAIQGWYIWKNKISKGKVIAL